MKRFFIIVAMIVMATSIFAQEQETETPEEEVVEFVYDMNGPGDQYIKLALMAFFPLNFGDQMYVGGAIKIGYHRFLTKWFAVGGDFMASYNATKGKNIFYALPITVGITFAPTVWKLEFPISLNVGIAFESSQSSKYFPGLVLNAELGAFYRAMENWSFGIGTTFMYLPQWFSGDEAARYGNYDHGLFITAAAMARYHF